jgi:hypothetical protein
MAIKDKDFIKAMRLANEIQFEYFEVSENHNENRFKLFSDENNKDWEILPTYNGKFNLSYGGKKVSAVGEDLEIDLDQFIENELSDYEINKDREEEYEDIKDEIFKEYLS